MLQQFVKAQGTPFPGANFLGSLRVCPVSGGGAAIRNSEAAQTHLIFFYDDLCPFCSGLAERLRSLDARARIRFSPVSDAAGLARCGISPDAACNRAQVYVVPTGLRFEGIDALLQVARTLPILWPLAPALWLAAFMGWGQAAYDWFARRRYTFTRPGQGS